MEKEKGGLLFSEGIKMRIKENEAYLAELYEILKHTANPLKREPLKYDYLNEEEQAEKNCKSLAAGLPHIVKQYPTSKGRIYIETISRKKKGLLFKRFSTDIRIYTATEYEHSKEDTKLFTFEQVI